MPTYRGSGEDKQEDGYTDAGMYTHTNTHTHTHTHTHTAKTYDDFYLTNRIWADIGGILLRDLNELELLFLKSMGWSLLLKREVCT